MSSSLRLGLGGCQAEHMFFHFDFGHQAALLEKPVYRASNCFRESAQVRKYFVSGAALVNASGSSIAAESTLFGTLLEDDCSGPLPDSWSMHGLVVFYYGTQEPVFPGGNLQRKSKPER